MYQNNGANYDDFSKLINQLSSDSADGADETFEKHLSRPLVATPKGGNGSIMSSVFNMTNGCIGTGILALPFAVSQCGIVLGPLLMLLFSALLIYTLVIICQTAMLHPEARSYETLVRESLGKKASIAMAACICFQTFGSCTSYIIIVADSFTPIMQLVIPQFTDYSYFVNRETATLFISLFFIFPLALQKQMHHLRFSSTFSVCCVCFIVFVVVFRSAQGLNNVSKHTITYFTNSGTSILTSIPLIVFAFRSHTSMPPIYKELRDNHLMRRVKAVIFFTMAICSVLYYTTSLFGYLTFFGDTQGNILTNYADDDILASVARGLLTIVMICHYPVVAYCCRSAIDFLIFGDKPLTNARHLLETLLLWGCCFGVSVLIPSITIVLGFAGSLPFTEFLFPSLFLRKFYKDPRWRGTTGRKAIVISTFYSVFAIIIAVACSSSIVYIHFIK